MKKRVLATVLAMMIAFSGIPMSVLAEGEDFSSSMVEYPERPAFSQSVEEDGVIVTVEAQEGVFPEEARLSVEAVDEEVLEKVDGIVEEVREEGAQVAQSYTFDVKVLDADGNELQPADGQSVIVSFETAEVADSNLDVQVYHISDEETAEKLEIEVEDEEVSAETDGFSYYTVEFTYNELQYVMQGDTSIALEDVLGFVGLTGEVTDVESSNTELFSAALTEDGWIVTAHQAFLSEEWMRITINDVVYEIVVTDAVKHTQAEAIQWLRNQKDKSYNHPSTNHGAQCTDFVACYMNWLVYGDPYYWGSGAYLPQTPTNFKSKYVDTQTNRWSIVYSPEPGDIFIKSGHCGVIVSKSEKIEQNVDAPPYNGGPARLTAGLPSSVLYYIRFKEFAAATPTPTPIPPGKEMTGGYDRVIPDGDYIIANSRHTDSKDSRFYFLDIQGTNTSAPNGTNVMLWDEPADEVGVTDVWTIKYNNGFYTIKQKTSNQYLTVYNADKNCGANVVVWQQGGATQANQNWAIKWVANGDDFVGFRIQS